MLNKIKTIQELRPLLEILRGTGKKIVFTNGCFDLIHTGHVRYLAKARSYGDLLVVAVNSDARSGSSRERNGRSTPRTTVPKRWLLWNPWILSRSSRSSTRTG